MTIFRNLVRSDGEQQLLLKRALAKVARCRHRRMRHCCRWRCWNAALSVHMQEVLAVSVSNLRTKAETGCHSPQDVYNSLHQNSNPSRRRSDCEPPKASRTQSRRSSSTVCARNLRPEVSTNSRRMTNHRGDGHDLQDEGVGILPPGLILSRHSNRRRGGT